ncbi:hypothetical protein JCM19992_16270 [Thermostilla marina]
MDREDRHPRLRKADRCKMLSQIAEIQRYQREHGLEDKGDPVDDGADVGELDRAAVYRRLLREAIKLR